MKIDDLYFRDLVLDEYAQYIGQCLGAIGDITIEDAQLQLLLDDIVPLHAKLNHRNNAIRKSSYTETIRTDDYWRDEDFLCMRHIVEGYTHHRDEAKREAAEYIVTVIKEIGWSLHNFRYEQQSGAIHSLKDKFNTDTKLKAAYETIAQTQRMTSLLGAQDKFEASVRLREQEEISQKDASASDVSKDLNEKFQELIQYIEMFARLTKRSEYIQMAEGINAISARYQTQIEARKTRRQKEQEAEETTSEQA